MVGCRTRRSISQKHLGAVFRARFLDNQEGAITERRVLRKALGETFPTPMFLAPTPFQLWRYQPWEIGPGECGSCDKHRRTR